MRSCPLRRPHSYLQASSGGRIELCSVHGVCSATCSGVIRVSGGCRGSWVLEVSPAEFGGRRRAMSSVLVTLLTFDDGFFGDSVDTDPRPSLDGTSCGAEFVLSRADFETVGRGEDGFDELAVAVFDGASCAFSHPSNPDFDDILRFLRGGSERRLPAAFSTSP